MIKTIENNMNGIVSLMADTIADKEDLIKYKVSAGSTCLVLEDSSVLMLGNDGVWHEI